MYGHLIAVEVRIECRTNQRMDLNGLSFDQHRFECLDAQAVKRRGTIEKDGMVLDDFFQNVPNY